MTKAASTFKGSIAALVVAVIVIDVVSKFLTHYFLPVMGGHSIWYPYGGIGVFKNFLGVEFSISHTTNKGAAWGVFASSQHLLLAFRMLLIGALSIYAGLFCKQVVQRVPLILVITGAACNVADYFFYGHVVDMFHFVLWGYDFPVFNIADSTIFFGVAWLILLSIISEASTKASVKEGK